MSEDTSHLDLQAAYDFICEHPDIHTPLPGTDIELFHVYKREVLALCDIPDVPEEERTQYLTMLLYEPFQAFWQCFGFSDGEAFAEQMGTGILTFTESWNQMDEMVRNPGFQSAFTTDFEAVFTDIARKTAAFTGRSPRGKWYLEFDMGGDMGGFGNGNMFANLLNIRPRGDRDGLTFSLPHEMHHQILDETRPSGPWTLGQCIVEEGFCCYFNYLFWEKRYSPALNIDFTEEEWTWCVKNERKIFEAAKPHLASEDQDIIAMFHQWHEYVWPDTPDRLAYFIGFRICEAYTAKHGADSWRELYGMTPDEIISKSGYLSEEGEVSSDG